MAQNDTSRTGRRTLAAARVLAIVVLLLAAGTLIFQKKYPGLPEMIPDELKLGAYDNIEAKAAASDAIRDLVSLYTTLSLGLVALVGFSIKDGLGKNVYIRSLNTLITSIVVYLIVRIVVYASDVYGTLAVQLDSGYLFISRINELVTSQGVYLVVAASLSLLIVALKIVPLDP